MKKILTFIILVSVVVNLTSCGLLINGRKQNIIINSNPQGAAVEIIGAGMTGITPARFNLKRNTDYQLIFKKDGYQQTMAYVNSDIEPLSLILDLFIFFPALIVDMPLGATYELNPENTYVSMQESK